MDGVTWFGLFAVSAMLIFYALEDRDPLCVLGFAVACALGSTYGFIQGAWPFGVVEAIWALVALRRWRVQVSSLRASRSNPGRHKSWIASSHSSKRGMAPRNDD